MKLVEYKQFNNSEEEKMLNKKKVTIVAVIIILILIVGILSIIYILNSNFRNFMDKYVLLKSVSEDNLPYISIDSEENLYTFAFYNYIAILKNNKLTLYDSSANEQETMEINISSPIYDVEDKYLVIAEENQQKIYLIKNKKILWEKDIEGQIYRINVNKKGYVSAIVSGTSYKSVIVTFNENGEEEFKTFLSSTLAVDVDISEDNKFLSFYEINLSGTLIESAVKTISFEKAKQDPANSIIHTYNLPSNVLITNLEYHEKEELLCISDENIYSLKNGNIETLANINENKITFAGIKLSKSYFKLVENTQGINNQNSNVEIYNTTNKNSYVYIINGIAKQVCSNEGVIAVNLGTEAYFISQRGWLIKKYTSNQEIKDILISNNIAGIVYRDKIELISL